MLRLNEECNPTPLWEESTYLKDTLHTAGYFDVPLECKVRKCSNENCLPCIHHILGHHCSNVNHSLIQGHHIGRKVDVYVTEHISVNLQN